MKRKYVIYLFLFLSFTGLSQQDFPRTYHWTELSACDYDTIFSISFSKMKLELLPEELTKFHNLRKLDLSRNRLVEFPDFISQLEFLEELDISRNEFQNFPVEICRLSSLKILIANRNEFTSIPECIGYCQNLISIDLWDTPVNDFPSSMVKLRNLKVLDLQGVRYSPSFQKKLKESMSWVEIKMDPPCDCME